MEKLFIDSTKSSPFIYYSEKNNTLLIKGNSYPNNIDEYFMPIYNWLKNYFKTHNQLLTIEFRLGYYNTSSTKAMINIISICNDAISTLNSLVEIKWHYLSEDDNSREDGEELALLAQFPFILVEEKD